jgi:hypothetical protein
VVVLDDVVAFEEDGIVVLVVLVTGRVVACSVVAPGKVVVGWVGRVIALVVVGEIVVDVICCSVVVVVVLFSCVIR